MRKSHGVKRIFHVAANYGQVGQGYIPIDQVAECVVNALKESDVRGRARGGASILFPLMATKSRRGTVLEDRIKPLLNAAIDYLGRNPDCTFRKVYFLTYTDKEFEVCREILGTDSRLKRLAYRRTCRCKNSAAETPGDGRFRTQTASRSGCAWSSTHSGERRRRCRQDHIHPIELTRNPESVCRFRGEPA